LPVTVLPHDVKPAVASASSTPQPSTEGASVSDAVRGPGPGVQPPAVSSSLGARAPRRGYSSSSSSLRSGEAD
jgi:hypothetical protein